MFSHCPKCGHAPLPQDQALPAACPACGVILAKVGQPVVRRPLVVDEDPDSLRGLLLEVPARVSPFDWNLRLAACVLFAAWGLYLMSMDPRTGEIAGSFLHQPLLVFHEAGHVLFMPFGRWMTVFGGSLTQVVIPVVMCVALLRTNRDPFGAVLALWFVGVSLMDVAPYMYDAFDPKLILLGGHTGQDGQHDWVELFSDMGLLKQARTMGLLTRLVGAGVVLLSLAWAAWVLHAQRAALSEASAARPGS